MFNAGSRLLAAVAAGLVAWSSPAAATSLVGVTPEGEVPRVRQLVLKFSDPVMPFGDASAAAPATLACTGAPQLKFSGRWQNERSYSFDFERELPAGVACRVSLRGDLRDVGGKPLDGRRDASFTTGGPTVLVSQPWGGMIEEGQHFQLQANGALDFASVEKLAYCQVKGVNERLPVVIVERDPLGEANAAKLNGRTPVPAGHSVTLRCQRPLPNDAELTLVWARGISTRSGVARSRDQRLEFRTRALFTASFSCERPQAKAPCSPLSPMRVEFSSPVPREMAQQVQLRGPAAAVRPVLAQDEPAVSSLQFAATLAENTDFMIEMPAGLKDEAGRALANGSLFPLKTRTGALPPLAKFAAAPFGIIELNEDASLPITVRNVEADLDVRAYVTGQQASATTLRVSDEASVIKWQRLLAQYHERPVQVGMTRGRNPQPVYAESRTLSLLKDAPAAGGDLRQVRLPAISDSRRPFEVIGLPLKDPGFYVVEVASQLLGRELLARDAPMYVRTGALVTNLAVHFKRGRENALVWVTSLDKGLPVADAQVRVSDCAGKQLWEGRTDRQGVARVAAELTVTPCEDELSGLLVTARKVDARGRPDFSFAWSGWNEGIESWRFNVPTDDSPLALVRAHTVFDRTLLRAGETVSMKHLLRMETMKGLEPVPASRLPNQMRITHLGSNQEYRFPLSFKNGRYAVSTFVIPKQAKLGSYEVTLLRLPDDKAKGAGRPGGREPDAEDDDESGRNSWRSGEFRVEEFRLPVLQGQIVPPKAPLVAASQVPVDVAMNFLSGGPAAELPVQMSATLRRRTLSFADYEEYNFNARPLRRGGEPGTDQDSDQEDGGRLVADKLDLKLDANGAGRQVFDGIKPATVPRELRVEASFNDPNGETQSIGATVPLYPAELLVGLRTGGWVSVGDKLALRLVTLDLSGKPRADVPVQVVGRSIKTISTRKRLAGGLYGYDNRTESTDLGVLCSGRSNARGEFECEAAARTAGQLELTAQARDAANRMASADGSVWVTGQGELWFDAENQDRIDLLPEKKRYEPGQVARLQVRMPFRHATALVAVEREGIIDTEVVTIDGDDPTIKVAIRDAYGPNVFVSVLAVRGRVREVPWYSMFTWGWQSPRQWLRERRAAVDYQPATAMVDLSKPAFKLGLAELRVGLAGHELKVTVKPERDAYLIRETARTKISVRLPDGKPAPAGTEVALAAVDQALLELRANDSWNLLEAMMQRRSYTVETATAQMQVVGKRHYGRKALPPGGDGGRAPTRELFDTLLLWKAAVVLDANGEATVDVPLNDSLTSFRIVAVADVGDAMFGTGAATIRVSQDLQLVSGLPPLVRDGDAFMAMATVRNGSQRAMKVNFSARSALASHDDQFELAAGAARELSWRVVVPSATGVDNPPDKLDWELSARDAGSKAADRIKVSQRLVEAVPVAVQQATMAQVDPALTLPVRRPAGALPGRGGLRITLQSKLADGLPGVRRYFEHYPFACLEQKTSKAIGLRDPALWKLVTDVMPSYLDDDGLAAYFPPSPAGGGSRGSDTLTAYLLSVTDEAARLDPVWAIAPAVRDQMERGLIAFVEGRVRRDYWSPQKDLTVRRLAAMEALSRSGKVTQAMVDTLDLDFASWPSGALLDWYAVLLRTPRLAQRDTRLAAAEQMVRARLSYQGTRLVWDNEERDNWWWLMGNADANSARLLALANEQPGWKDDAPRLALGLLGRFRSGHWMTTNANLLGSLAVDNFSRRFEATTVNGYSAAVLRSAGQDDAVRRVDWSALIAAPAPAPSRPDAMPTTGAATVPAGASATTVDLPWSSGTPMLALAHDGAGKPWATIQSLAAVPLTQAVKAGYAIERTVEPVKVRTAGVWSRGDVVRVKLRVTAQAPATWVVLSDPVPAGATVLGSGLGRDSEIDNRPSDSSGRRNWDQPWVAFEERAFEAYRVYYQYVSSRPFEVEYNLRLNNPGEFRLPPTRIEAMYNPEMFGALPNAPVRVMP